MGERPSEVLEERKAGEEEEKQKQEPGGEHNRERTWERENLILTP